MAYQRLLTAFHQAGTEGLHAEADRIVAELERGYPTLNVGEDRDPVDCPTCGADDIWMVEDGYMRWTRCDNWDVAGPEAELDRAVLHLRTDGWDDFSEDGEIRWFQCMSCNARFQWEGEMAWD